MCCVAPSTLWFISIRICLELSILGVGGRRERVGGGGAPVGSGGEATEAEERRGSKVEVRNGIIFYFSSCEFGASKTPRSKIETVFFFIDFADTKISRPELSVLCMTQERCITKRHGREHDTTRVRRKSPPQNPLDKDE